MSKSEILVTIKNKEPLNKKQVRDFFACPDGKYRFIRERIDKRSNPQNAYYWSCVVPMVKDGLRHMGFDEVRSNEDAHEILKHLFLKRPIINPETGEVLSELAGSTTKLTKEQFGEYLENIWRWAAEYLGVTIPSPNEQTSMFNDNKAA